MRAGVFVRNRYSEPCNLIQQISHERGLRVRRGHSTPPSRALQTASGREKLRVVLLLAGIGGADGSARRAENSDQSGDSQKIKWLQYIFKAKREGGSRSRRLDAAERVRRRDARRTGTDAPGTRSFR